MRSHKLCILLATLIAIGQYSCEALTCVDTNLADVTCPANITECFVQIGTDKTISRGCATDATCAAPSCFKCLGDKCNTAMICQQCNNSQSTCLTSTAAVDGFNALCTPGQQCLNWVNTDGTVARGCGTDCPTGNLNCTKCDTNFNCNAGLFPEKRRLCYQCTGNACNTVEATMLGPCPTYKEGQECYVIGTSATDMTRGCNTDVGDGNKCSANPPPANCLLCNEDGCNAQTFEHSTGSCYNCSDSTTCVGEQKADQASKPIDCPPANYLQTGDTCYVKQLEGGVVERGCTSALKEACNQGCKTCNSSNCNSQASGFGCLVCRSDFYSPCRDAQYGVSACPESTGPYANKCFAGQWDGVVIRGCLSEATPVMQFQCNQTDNAICIECSISGCNTQVFKGGASTMQHFGLALIGLVFMVCQLL